MDGGFIDQGYLTDLLRCGVIGSPMKEQEAYDNASRDANMDAEIRIHPKCEELPTQRDIRRCVNLDNDRIVIVEGNATRVSADDGRSWSDSTHMPPIGRNWPSSTLPLTFWNSCLRTVKMQDQSGRAHHLTMKDRAAAHG